MCETFYLLNCSSNCDLENEKVRKAESQKVNFLLPRLK